MRKALFPLAAAVLLGAAATIPTEPRFNDKQIAAALKSINDHEIELAEMADDKATRSDVKEYAAMMKREHEMMNDQVDDLDDLEGDEDATPLLDELERTQGEAHDQLDRLDSAGFDAAYMTHMVGGHQKALDMVDNKFMPTATSPELRQLLQAAKTKMEAHLRQAERIQASAGSMPAMGRDTTHR